MEEMATIKRRADTRSSVGSGIMFPDLQEVLRRTAFEFTDLSPILRSTSKILRSDAELVAIENKLRSTSPKFFEHGLESSVLSLVQVKHLLISEENLVLIADRGLTSSLVALCARSHDHRSGPLPARMLGKLFLRAAEAGKAGAVEALMADPRVNPAANGSACLRDACCAGHAAVVRALLTDGRSSPGIWGQYCLLRACENGHAEVVEALLRDPRTNPMYYHGQALRIAAHRGHLPVVRALLADPRVDPTVAGNAAFVQACAKARIAVVEELLSDPRVDPAAFDNNALYHALVREMSRPGGPWGPVTTLLLEDARVRARAGPLLAQHRERLEVKEREAARLEAEERASVERSAAHARQVTPRRALAGRIGLEEDEDLAEMEEGEIWGLGWGGARRHAGPALAVLPLAPRVGLGEAAGLAPRHHRHDYDVDLERAAIEAEIRRLQERRGVIFDAAVGAGRVMLAAHEMMRRADRDRWRVGLAERHVRGGEEAQNMAAAEDLHGMRRLRLHEAARVAGPRQLHPVDRIRAIQPPAADEAHAAAGGLLELGPNIQ